MSKNRMLTLLLSTALATALAAPASSHPLRAAPGGLSAAASEATAVQYRYRRWAGPRPGWHARWGRPYWRNGWWYYNNNGAWVAAAATGLAVGAAAAAANNAAAYNQAVAYCMQRYRSYNPATRTYTGYDGLQHPCP